MYLATVGFGIPSAFLTPASALNPQAISPRLAIEFFKHPSYLYSIMNKGWPYSTAWPAH
jgi:hypothetical protein